MTENNPAAAHSDRVLVLTRDFDVPRDLVWQAWTDPAHVAQWWGPRGFANTIHQMEVRPGGVWRLVMHGPDGRDYRNRIEFLEVVPAERLVYRHTGDEDVEPVTVHVTVTFAEHGGKTRITMRSVFPSAEERDRVVREYGAVEGGIQTLDRLGEQLAVTGACGPVFVLTRTCDAPRDLVFKAWTEAERLKHWWGPKGFTVHSCKIALRPGGIFHYGMRAPGGSEMWGKWSFRDVIPPRRLVFVNSFADEQGNTVRPPFSEDWPPEVLSEVTFTEDGGRTTLTIRGVPINATGSQRKTFESGFESMRQGWGGTLDQLADFLAKG